MDDPSRGEGAVPPLGAGRTDPEDRHETRWASDKRASTSGARARVCHSRFVVLGCLGGVLFVMGEYKPDSTCCKGAFEMLASKLSLPCITAQHNRELLVNLCAADHRTVVGEEPPQVLGWILGEDNNLQYEDWAACSLRSSSW